MASVQEIAMYGLLVLAGILGYLILAPFLGAIILALVFAFLFYPLYNLLNKILWSGLASLIVLGTIFLIIVIPSIYLAGTLVGQASDAYQMVQAQGVSIFDEASIAGWVESWLGFDVHGQVVELFAQSRTVIKNALPKLLISAGGFLISLFIFFFVLYFALKDGANWFEYAIKSLPMSERRRHLVGEKMRRQAQALLYGHILTSVIVGVIVGGMLWYANIPNAVFWGVITVILGVIPVLGAFLVYIPAGAWLLWQGAWLNGALVLGVCAGTHLLIDNVLRPKMVSKAAEIHPVLVILGALGGIAMLGVVGFLIGPLILSFFVIMLETGNEAKTVPVDD